MLRNTTAETSFWCPIVCLGEIEVLRTAPVVLEVGQPDALLLRIVPPGVEIVRCLIMPPWKYPFKVESGTTVKSTFRELRWS